MSVEERDRYSGHLTTGHEWNGIKELNTPVPTIVVFFLVTTFIFSVGYWILMPAWPGINSYTQGKLNFSQHDVLQEQIRTAEARQRHWSDDLVSAPLSEAQGNPALIKIANESGPALFKDNCAVCHGQQGEGGLYFPRLTDDSWLWGDDVDGILKTLQVGINTGMPGTRVAIMPAFGSTGILTGQEIEQVSTYLRSLSNSTLRAGKRVEELLAVKNGKVTYQAYCLACHGTEALGNTLLGAPNLTDDFWIYGGSQESIVTTLQKGRAGQMPAWSSRLSDIDMRVLSLYVAGLSDQPDDDVR